MGNFLIEKIRRYAYERPESPALMMDGGKDRISYAELDRLSGSVYAALKERSIGREDMVMIFLPRGVQVYICMLGIIKTGAAFTILEDTISIDRKEYIAKDANCRLIIDSQLYADMVSRESIPGYECPGSHDACFAVYTSGSAGFPKGVLHEYGQIEVYINSAPINILSGNNDELDAIVAPLNFIAPLFQIFSVLDVGACAIVVDYQIVNNKESLISLFEERRVTHTFLTPSLFKGINDIPACVKQIFIGGEPVHDTYVRGIEIDNTYSSSESGFVVCTFPIDRPYSLTPVGKNRYGIDKIFLLDENGQETDRGEICFKNPYCRGYIGLPELNREAFRDGLYHSGDEGYFNENGDLVVCGRIDDMLKIRGNRVEPGEVEEAVKKVLHTETVVVKGFCQNEREFLVAYSCGEEKDRKQIKADLRNILPEYMIPSFYVFLDKFPTLPNGKIDKKSLEVPVLTVSDFANDAPENEVEAYFCHLFEETLSVELVGRNDDYFDLGGDSLTAMKMLSGCKLKGVSIPDLYELRTPAKISERYLSRALSDNYLKNRRIMAMQSAQHALVETQVVFDFQKLAPQSTMWNLSFLLQMNSRISAEKLKETIDRVLKHHPVFSSVFILKDGQIFQEYRPELYEGIQIVYTTESEFSKLKPGLVRKYESLFDSLLYRKAIYVTEERMLLFFDIHHSIADGASLHLLLKQIYECYQTPDAILPEDFYYLILENNYSLVAGYQDEKNEMMTHYRSITDKFLCDGNFMIPVRYDDDDISRKRGSLQLDLRFSKSEVRKFIRRNRLSENVFFATACLLSIAKFNGASKSMLLFVHSGRDDAMRASSCGLLLHDIPLFLDLEGNPELSAVLSEVKAQEEYGIANGNFNISYLIDNSFHQALSFSFQKDMLSVKPYEMIESRIALQDPDAASALLELSVIDNEEREAYRLSVTYSSANYREESIQKLAELFVDSVEEMLQSV